MPSPWVLTLGLALAIVGLAAPPAAASTFGGGEEDTLLLPAGRYRGCHAPRCAAPACRPRRRVFSASAGAVKNDVALGGAVLNQAR